MRNNGILMILLTVQSKRLSFVFAFSRVHWLQCENVLFVVTIGCILQKMNCMVCVKHVGQQ